MCQETILPYRSKSIIKYKKDFYPPQGTKNQKIKKTRVHDPPKGQEVNFYNDINSPLKVIFFNQENKKKTFIKIN